uniref:Uncharacterized protein n=1 Tax=Myotis myotis TaxID=51298 RepID=A0A7J8AL45_MYOMY|nr:hypothetical protein mMyoMyo1_007802 [Myotis myotis]
MSPVCMRNTLSLRTAPQPKGFPPCYQGPEKRSAEGQGQGQCFHHSQSRSHWRSGGRQGKKEQTRRGGSLEKRMDAVCIGNARGRRLQEGRAAKFAGRVSTVHPPHRPAQGVKCLPLGQFTIAPGTRALFRNGLAPH